MHFSMPSYSAIRKATLCSPPPADDHSSPALERPGFSDHWNKDKKYPINLLYENFHRFARLENDAPLSMFLERANLEFEAKGTGSPLDKTFLFNCFLVHAAQAFLPELCETLVMCGANVNIEIENHPTPLIAIITHRFNSQPFLDKFFAEKSLQLIQFFLQHGGNPLAYVVLEKPTDEELSALFLQYQDIHH